MIQIEVKRKMIQGIRQKKVAPGCRRITIAPHRFILETSIYVSIISIISN